MSSTIYSQETPQDSPWTIRQRIKMLFWEYTWSLLCSWTPKPANNWRLFWLKIFGAKLHGKPFVHQRARIQIPWNLVMHHKACIGDRANIYSLGEIVIGANAVVAQEAYICTGTHAFDTKSMNLITKTIHIGDNVFVGSRAFVMPGVTLGDNAIVAAMSVVTKDVESWAVVGGNPARFIKKREIKN